MSPRRARFDSSPRDRSGRTSRHHQPHSFAIIRVATLFDGLQIQCNPNTVQQHYALGNQLLTVDFVFRLPGEFRGRGLTSGQVLERFLVRQDERRAFNLQ